MGVVVELMLVVKDVLVDEAVGVLVELMLVVEDVLVDGQIACV